LLLAAATSRNSSVKNARPSRHEIAPQLSPLIEIGRGPGVRHGESVDVLRNLAEDPPQLVEAQHGRSPTNVDPERPERPRVTFGRRPEQIAPIKKKESASAGDH